MKKTASAVWQGGLKDGKGTLSTESGALKDNPYGFNTRFEGAPGTNPEELIGAAHAGCFSMALSMMLGEAGLTAERYRDPRRGHPRQAVRRFRHHCRAPGAQGARAGADAQTFEQIANKAKAGCPVSKVLNAKISLDASLDG